MKHHFTLRNRRLWFGGCCYCGRWHSLRGLGLQTSVWHPDIYAPYSKMKPFRSYCVECDKIHHPGSYTLNMQSVFLEVDRIPWVPTEDEQRWWNLWDIDAAFENRRTVW